MKPPTIHMLLEDPIYRAFVKRNADHQLAVNLRQGEPWQVWARTTEDPARWRGARFSSYPDAWASLVKAVRNRARYADVTIVSRRQLFTPPPGLNRETWPRQFEWCGRCRRPSYFAYRPRHHALRDAPVLTEDDPYRCFYCGVRRAFMPAYPYVGITPATTHMSEG